jgi:hypothetical protein
MAGADEGTEDDAPKRPRLETVDIVVIILVAIAVALLTVAILRLGEPEVERSTWCSSTRPMTRD